MKHEIDLKNYQLHSDLAIDNDDIKEINIKKINDVKITDIYINEDEAKRINKEIGNYITIEFKDATDCQNIEDIKKVLIEQLDIILRRNGINDNDSCMIIGLGNKESTPDSLGPLVLDDIVVTNHLYELGNVDKNFRKTFAFEPSVKAKTGMETSEVINSIIKESKPNFLIVIDSLASGSIDRLNKTIQITDTGISPGSGIGNNRKAINKKTFNLPVIAIGIPTVVDAVTIVSDTINYIYKDYVYTKENKNNPKNRLILSSNINYLNSKIEVKKEDKKNVLGIIGDLGDEEIKELIYEVLTPIGYNLMVTPKEIDFVIKKLAKLLSDCINSVLHKKFR